MHNVFPCIKAWKKKPENQWLERFKCNHQLQVSQSYRKDTCCNIPYLCCVSLLLEILIHPKSWGAEVWLGNSSKGLTDDGIFSDSMNSRVTRHSWVSLLSVWPIFPLLHCIIFCSRSFWTHDQGNLLAQLGLSVMMLWSQIHLSSRKTGKLAKCSSISTNIWSNLIFQPPVKKWTVNSIIVRSKTQQCCWLQAMPLLGQLSFMLGNKILLSLECLAVSTAHCRPPRTFGAEVPRLFYLVYLCVLCVARCFRCPMQRVHGWYCIITALLSCSYSRQSMHTLHISYE